MGRIKAKCNKLIFWLLLFMGLGYLPSGLGIGFLILAALVCPIKVVREWVDWFLESYTVRSMWIILIVVIMGFYPITEFYVIVQRIVWVLETVSRWFGNFS